MPRKRTHAATRTFAALGVGAIALYGSRVLLNFFGPELGYSMRPDAPADLQSDDFLRFLSLVTDGTVRNAHLTRLRNGAEFYPAQLEAIRSARHTINLEFYEFLPGDVSRAFVEALTERARAGVEVRLIVDAVGSFSTPCSYFQPLLNAGGEMHFYHPLHWNTWQNANNRTHRKLLIVDGCLGFLGGAGIADHWLHRTPAGPAWRDTVFRVEGDAVAGLTSTFAENWLEASGQILSNPHQFRFHHLPDAPQSLVVSSTPHGGGTRARVLFQALLNTARHTITITTPYFLPDRSARRALITAVRDRGVRVRILTAGPRIDHPFIRSLSRHSSRHLLHAGAEIFEYQPSMIHSKLLTVDGEWLVAGSTNFDHRSFALNDEVNLAIRDRAIVQTVNDDFEDDLRQSRELSPTELDHTLAAAPEVAALDHALEQES